MQEIVTNIPTMAQEKKWYLFIGPHHIGPFNQDQVVDLYKKNKINAETMIFCQGMNEWRSLNSLPEWRELLIFDLEEREVSLKKELSQDIREGISRQIKEEELKELMNTPQLDEIPSIPIAPKAPSAYFQIKEMAKNFVPPRPLKKTFKESDRPPVFEPPPFSEQIEKAPLKNEQNHSPPVEKVEAQEENSSRDEGPSFAQLFFKGALFLSLLTFLGVIAAFIILSPKEDKNMEKIIGQLPSSKRAKLLAITRENTLPFLKIGLELLQNGEKNSPQFLMSFNRQGPFVMNATLTSLPKKILSLKAVNMTAKGNAGLHFAHFKKWTLEKGVEFTPGFYSLDLKLEAKGLTNGTLETIQQWGIFNFIPMIRDYKNSYNYHGLFWLGVSDEKSFEQSLAQFYKKLLEEKSRPLQERVERWKMVNMILLNLKDSFLTSLGQIKSGKQYRVYEKIYVKKVAPPLQQLMMTYIKEKKQTDPLFIVAKDIGKLGADMSELIRSKAIITPLLKEDLKKTFEENWEVSFNSSVTQINKIESELQIIAQEYSLE